MVALPGKYLWPLIGVIIFALLATFYISDRGRLAREKNGATVSQDVASNAMAKDDDATSNQSGAAPGTPAAKNTVYHSTSGDTFKHQGFSGSINDYLLYANTKRSAELKAAVKDHQGFSGSIEDYLGGRKPEAMANGPSYNTSSMSIEEYLACAEYKSSSKTATTNTPYSGSIDGYLAKYGAGRQPSTACHKTH